MLTTCNDLPLQHCTNPPQPKLSLALVHAKNNDVIKGMLAGHNYRDTFSLFFGDSDDSDLVSFSAASATPEHISNPSYRIYSANPESLLDYSQYILNLATYQTSSVVCACHCRPMAWLVGACLLTTCIDGCRNRGCWNTHSRNNIRYGRSDTDSTTLGTLTNSSTWLPDDTDI
jgi:hypothetical protein